VLYDVTSSYYEGRTCPWARRGHDRDGQKGLPIIVYGVMADNDGRPIGVEIYPGNTGDPTTIVDQVNKLRENSLGLRAWCWSGTAGCSHSRRLTS
jgi:transposase